jgi:hypothetical protein
MSNRINRYKTIYEALARPDFTSQYARHVFVRSQNFNGNKYQRLGDR